MGNAGWKSALSAEGGAYDGDMDVWKDGKQSVDFCSLLGIQCVAGRCGEAWQIEVVCASGTYECGWLGVNL